MISFFSLNISFTLKHKLKVKQWIKTVIREEKKLTGDISIIFCDDEHLLTLNNQFLQHDYYTDIITFNYNTNKINGDLFISIDRVNDNAAKQNVSRETELLRVIIHGILHLLGYGDKTKKEIKIIRELEDKALLQFSNL